MGVENLGDAGPAPLGWGVSDPQKDVFPPQVLQRQIWLFCVK